MTEFQHAGLECNIEVGKHEITVRGVSCLLFAAGCQILLAEEKALLQLDLISYTKMLARHFTGCFPPPVLVQASTLPVVVVSSTNQVVGAWASVMWSNMLSTSDPRVKISLAT